MKPIPYLIFRETSPHAPCFHLVRHTFKPRSSFYRHGHRDFAEVFWVEGGTGLHHVNGIAQRLEPGMLVLIRQTDIHGVATHGRESLTVVNCSFPTLALQQWPQRYFGGRPLFFWSRETLPPTYKLEADQLQRLQKWTDHLSICPNERFHLDWFLLDLMHLLEPGATHGVRVETLPERLRVALREIRQLSHFSGGVHELARLAGCSLQHLNRLLKQHKQPPAGEIVTDARLQHAARELRLTDRKIIDLGLEVGFNNLGHFYQVFKKRYGLTPRQFRLRQQQSVWQGIASAPAPKRPLRGRVTPRR